MNSENPANMSRLGYSVVQANYHTLGMWDLQILIV